MLALSAARMFDGRSDDVAGPTTVVADEGRIVAVLPADSPLPPDLQVVQFGDATLLPGLIDTHVHLCLDGSPAPIDHLLARDSDALLAAMDAAAQSHLRAGVTTVRDLGDRDFAALELRERYRRGGLGPTLLCAGPPLTVANGHCHFLGGVLDGDPAAMVARWAQRGVDVIKVMVSGGEITPGSSPYTPQMDAATVRAVAEAARLHGLAVTAHVHDPVSVGFALDAGVDGLEHCSFWITDGVSDDAQMRARVAASGVFVCPTGGVLPGGTPPPSVASRLPFMARHMSALHGAGARLIAGSDGGIAPPKPHGLLPYSVLQMLEFGLTPAQALRSATALAAEACGLQGRKGVLSVGADADIIAVPGNVLSDLAALMQPLAVVAGGTMAMRRE